MRPMLDRWTVPASTVLVLAALLACKKKQAATVPSALPIASVPMPVPSASAVASASPEAAAPAEVKRYPQEQPTSGTVRVAAATAKVYSEADSSTPERTELVRGTLVNRKALLGTWMLVEYPSGPNQLSLGWVEAKDVSSHLEKTKAVATAKTTAKTTATATQKTATATQKTATAPTTTSIKVTAPNLNFKKVFKNLPKPVTTTTTKK